MDNVIKIPELTEECLEKFLKDSITSAFIDKKTRELIIELFRKDKANGFKSGMFQLLK